MAKLNETFTAAPPVEPKPYQRNIPDSWTIPHELHELPIWCAWKLVPRKKGEKPGKVPVSPITRRCEGSDLGNFYTTLERAIHYAEGNPRMHGIGIRLFPEHGLIAGDLDGCRDPVTGEVDQQALEILRAADSYAEISPGLTGFRFIARGTFGGYTGNNGQGVEFYEKNQFVTITGEHLEHTPFTIEKRNLRVLGRKYFAKKEKTAPPVEDTPSEPLRGFLSAIPQPDKLPPHIREWIVKGVPEGQDRSTVLFGAAKDLMRAGCSDAMTLAILSNPDHRIFDCALERRNGDQASARQWIKEHTLPKARAEIEAEAGEFEDTEDSTGGDPSYKHPPRFPLTRFGDLQLKAPDWLVKGWLERDSLALIFGQSGAGKSFVALDLACCIATGRDWHGHKVKQGPVVILAGEGQNGIARRLTAWQLDRGISLAEAPIYLSHRAEPLDEGVSAVLDALEPIRPVAVFVDTLNRHMHGDENSAKETGAFIRSLDAIRLKYQCLVATLHHSGHADKDRARGSTAIRAAMDAEIAVSMAGGLDLGSAPVVTVEATKQKDAAHEKPLSFELTPVDLGIRDDEGMMIQSAVLQAVEHQRKAKRMSGRLRFAMETFFEACPDLTMEPLKVELEAWRKVFYSKHTADSTESKRKIFSAARKSLVDDGTLKVLDDVYSCNTLAAPWPELKSMVAALNLSTGGDG